jgi:hypothetical protein
MPALIINIVNGTWCVRVANTQISYNFDGADLAQQARNVREFASIMSENNPDVGFFLQEDVPEEQLAQQLFGTTDQILYVDRLIYATVGEDMLIEDLELAGRVLLEAL